MFEKLSFLHIKQHPENCNRSPKEHSSTIVNSGRDVSKAVCLPKEITLKRIDLMCNLIINKSALKKFSLLFGQTSYVC